MHINRFLDDHPVLSAHQRAKFVDDGYAGTNFDRPQFQKMMSLVRAGEINAICVKDFSRFSLDYIETGNYLECVFPFLGIGFISVNDGYDSDDYKGMTSCYAEHHLRRVQQRFVGRDHDLQAPDDETV